MPFTDLNADILHHIATLLLPPPGAILPHWDNSNAKRTSRPRQSTCVYGARAVSQRVRFRSAS